MIINFDLLGYKDGSVVNTRLAHSEYTELHVTAGHIDDIFVDTNVSIPFFTEQPATWAYSTVMYAKLNGDLEGGSAEARGMVIESIKLQKRKEDSVEWIDVGELEYFQGEKYIYEFLDKIVANGEIYEYSLLPITASVIGNRTFSEPVQVNFEGVFLSDADFNYKLLYDIEYGEINHNTPSAIHQPLNAQYPIIAYSNLDYTDFNLQATFISAQTIIDKRTNTQEVNIRTENIERSNLLKFLKNRKPKFYRDDTGALKMVTVIDNPQEIPRSDMHGIANLSVHLIEVGTINNETLNAYNMIPKVSGE